jgi:hypothetical protein
MSDEFNNYDHSGQDPNEHSYDETSTHSYDDTYYYNDNVSRSYEETPSPNGLGIASLVCGILALITFCMCINIPLGIVSIILGIIQIVKYEKKGMAIAGIVTSAISIIAFGILALFGGLTYQRMLENGDLMQFYEDIYEMQDEDGNISDEDLQDYLDDMFEDEEYYDDEYYDDEYYDDHTHSDHSGHEL